MSITNQTSKARRRLLAAGVAMAAGFAVMTGAQAQGNYPTKPITMIVPFSAGGTTDILARIVGLQLGKALVQPVVIENRDRKSTRLNSSH